MLTMRKDISATKERERQLRIELAAKERMIKKMERFESMVIELQSENAHLKEAVARVQQESVAPTSGLSHGEQVHGSRTIPAVLILLLVFLAGGFYVWKNGIPGRKSVRTATPTVAPSLPTARIFHPTELTDVALGMAETLSNMGVQVQALEPLTNPVARTTVFYAQGKEETAHSIAGRLGPDTDLRPRDWPSGADLIIVLGEDRLE
ncbi:MAG: LytR C-terminal domain-containing protein [Nitrospirae bacterium]|nr:LytR C-terminal domain-containing protein [Nitrospirota bacterium]